MAEFHTVDPKVSLEDTIEQNLVTLYRCVRFGVYFEILLSSNADEIISDKILITNHLILIWR